METKQVFDGTPPPTLLDDSKQQARQGKHRNRQVTSMESTIEITGRKAT